MVVIDECQHNKNEGVGPFRTTTLVRTTFPSEFKTDLDAIENRWKAKVPAELRRLKTYRQPLPSRPGSGGLSNPQGYFVSVAISPTCQLLPSPMVRNDGTTKTCKKVPRPFDSMYSVDRFWHISRVVSEIDTYFVDPIKR